VKVVEEPALRDVVPRPLLCLRVFGLCLLIFIVSQKALKLNKIKLTNSLHSVQGMNKVALHMRVFGCLVYVVHGREGISDGVHCLQEDRSNSVMPSKISPVNFVDMIIPCKKSVITIPNI
jgi:hypothetical protein